MEKLEETAMPKKRIRYSEQHRGTEDGNEEPGQCKPAAVSPTKTMEKPEETAMPKKRIRYSEQHSVTEDGNEEPGQCKPAAVSPTKTTTRCNMKECHGLEKRNFLS